MFFKNFKYSNFVLNLMLNFNNCPINANFAG